MEAGLQRRFALDELELLGEEEVDAHQPEDADQVGANRSAEGWDFEQLHVDQRRFQR